MSTIFMEHIPRTIFGVKYNTLMDDGSQVFNRYELAFTKNQQLRLFDKLSKDSKNSEVKMIRWHINANDGDDLDVSG